MPTDQTTSRVAIVLGAAVLPDGSASPTLRLRVDHGIDLLLAGQVDMICLTGGQGLHGRPEAVVARDIAVSRGVSDAAILVEPVSKSTFENLVFAFPILPEDAAITLVSSRWHLPRAWLILRLLGRRGRLSGPPTQTPFHKTMVAILREVATTPLSIRRIVTRAYRNGR